MRLNLVNTIFDIFLPKRCVGCGKEGKYLCDKCNLFTSEAPLIFPGDGFEGVVGIWEYEGVIKKLLHEIKYNGLTDAVGEMVERAFEIWEVNIPEDTFITYVPMHKNKEKERGFNQAELIAKKVGEITNKEALPLLIKAKDNPSQVGLNSQERIKNVKDVFSFREGFTCPDNVLVIDDFWISGTTMKECFKVLKQAGAKNVWGFTLARIV